MVRQFVVMVVAALVSALILVKTDIVGRLTYSMEKAKLRATRDSFPELFHRLDRAVESARIDAARERLPAAGGSARIESGRHLAAAVLPAVVSISTERIVARSSLEGLDPLFHPFLVPRREETERDAREKPADESAADANTSGLATGETELETETAPGETAEPEESEESGGPTIQLPNSQGSGFIFDSDNGYILTNYHVIEDSDSISVRLWDGRRYPARPLGMDKKTDLAVIQINAPDLHELPIGDSASGEVGDEVFAVGNPFGLAGSISRGIISAKNRSNLLLEDVEYQGFLQTDAVINGGNSGGPLVNARGEVIGINCSIATTTGFFDGIGFAIPSSRATKAIPFLVKGEKVLRGYLGVSMGAASRLEEEDLDAFGWSESYGVIVSAVLADSPACAAGLRTNDILLSFNGQRLGSTAELTQSVADTPPGSEVTFEIWRDKKLIAIDLEVGRQPDNFSTRGGRPQRLCGDPKPE